MRPAGPFGIFQRLRTWDILLTPKNGRNPPTKRRCKIWKVYIIHFDKSYYRARHYVGITSLSLMDRLKKHINKGGSKLTAAAAKAGINFTIHEICQKNTRSEARQEEKRIKARHEGGLFCPLCHNEVKRRKQERGKKRKKK